MPDKSAADARRPRGRPRDWDDKTEQNTIKSLDRAIEVLERLGELGGTTLSGLAADLGQSPATIYRVLITLEGRDVVEFDPVGQIWQIGSGAFLIGSRFLRRTSLVERARPVLRSLMESSGETANLAIEKDGRVLFLSQVETHASIRAFFPPGTMSPMHASGIGKALLAQLPPARQQRILAETPLERFTPNTLATAAALTDELAQIRTRGYAIDDEERNLGMKCVAAPVFDVHGEAVAGLSVSGPTGRMHETAALADLVTGAAHRLTRAIGGMAPDNPAPA
ncbi:MAG: IclR family transcriptional regulator [Rhodobacteraceae bacterium]|nr:IclR family transcriptional regulator [Paracoccaceae bacterium]